MLSEVPSGSKKERFAQKIVAVKKALHLESVGPWEVDLSSLQRFNAGVWCQDLSPGFDGRWIKRNISRPWHLCHMYVFSILVFERWQVYVSCWHEFMLLGLGFRFVRADKPSKQPLNSCDCRLQPLGSRICAWGCHIARCAERHFPTLSRYFEAMREAICIHIGQGGAMFSSFMYDLPEMGIRVGGW